MSKLEFERVVQESLLSSLRMVGEDCLHSVMSFVNDGREKTKKGAPIDLQEVDRALDTLYSKFSRVIKYVTILQISSALKQEAPKVKSSLFWMVEELRAETW